MGFSRVGWYRHVTAFHSFIVQPPCGRLGCDKVHPKSPCGKVCAAHSRNETKKNINFPKRQSLSHTTSFSRQSIEESVSGNTKKSSTVKTSRSKNVWSHTNKGKTALKVDSVGGAALWFASLASATPIRPHKKALTSPRLHDEQGSRSG